MCVYVCVCVCLRGGCECSGEEEEQQQQRRRKLILARRIDSIIMKSLSDGSWRYERTPPIHM